MVKGWLHVEEVVDYPSTNATQIKLPNQIYHQLVYILHNTCFQDAYLGFNNASSGIETSIDLDLLLIVVSLKQYIIKNISSLIRSFKKIIIIKPIVSIDTLFTKAPRKLVYILSNEKYT